jgi:hypothetical protein
MQKHGGFGEGRRVKGWDTLNVLLDINSRGAAKRTAILSA